MSISFDDIESAVSETKTASPEAGEVNGGHAAPRVDTENAAERQQPAATAGPARHDPPTSLSDQVTSSDVANGTGSKTGAAPILAVLTAAESEGSPDEVLVEECDEADAAPVPDTVEQAKKREKKRDLWREALREAGVPESKIEGLVVKRAVTSGRQRKRPDHASPCHPEMIEFWATRTDDEIEADCLKLCRRDGGKAGPLRRFVEVLEAHGADQGTALSAAPAIDDLFQNRVGSIRIYLTCGTNERRRRKAERDGRDPRRAKYLRTMVRADTK